MNMKKVLAAGVAATLAVSSLAAVASAEETRSFDMINTVGTLVYSPNLLKGAEAIDPGDDYDFVAGDPTIPTGPRTYKLSANVTNAVTGTQEAGPAVDTNKDGIHNELDFDAFIPFHVWGTNASFLTGVGDLKVTIKGKKIASNGATTVDLVQTATLLKVASVNGDDDANYILPIYNNGGPASAAFVPERFVQIDEISFSIAISDKGDKKYEADQDLYEPLLAEAANGNDWKVGLVWDTGDGDIQAYSDAGNFVQNWQIGDNAWEWDGDCVVAQVRIELYDAFNADAMGNNQGNVVYTNDACFRNADDLLVIDATAFTLAEASDTYAGGLPLAPVADNMDGGLACSKIQSMLRTGCVINWQLNSGKCYTTDTPAWLPRTEDPGDGNDIISRNEVWLLSWTADYNSQGIVTSENILDDQTYTVVDYNKGTKPRGFSGLASQVADFFNTQKNGKIELVFDPAQNNAAASSWKNGGIPSTEVGLRNFLEAAQVKDFALFINYNSSTGSLQSNATLDVYAGSVIFDISDSLKDMGGWTKGNVNDIYYGLNNGITQKDGTIGLWVSKVVLSFDPDTAVSGDTATKDDEKEAEVKDDDKGDVAPVADDDEIEISDDTDDDDDSAIVIGDDDDDDATVVVTPDDDATVVVNPGTATPAGADENPHTGVALAVVPMIAAAAAMVISKKRK